MAMNLSGASAVVIPEKFDADPARSYTLPASLYTDPAVFEEERESIFFNSWQFAGHVESLREAGSYITTRVLDQEIFVIRTRDGALKAFYNVCRHRAHQLLVGTGCVSRITCPYHAWSYDLDGKLRHARGSERVDGFERSEFCLNQVQVEDLRGLIFVNLDPAAAPLSEQAAGLAEELREYAPELTKLTFAKGCEFSLQANWKVVADNFLECYHCPPAHPAFCDLVDVSRYRSTTHAIHSTHFTPALPRGQAVYTIKPDDPVQCGVFIYLWPNTAIAIFPGSHNLSVLHLIPDGCGRTLETWDFYFQRAEMTPEEADQVDYLENILNVEDIALCENVQRGLHSRGYQQGRFIVDADRTDISEHAVHHFHGLVHAALART